MGEVVKAEFGKRGALRFGMTARQRKALAFIRHRIDATGEWPSLRDIQSHLNLFSPVGARMIVHRLADIGAVTLPESWSAA